MELIANEHGNDLQSFLTFLFDGLEGIAYVAEKNPSDDTDWKQHYFNVPAELSRLETVIQASKNSSEVYLAPALYSKPDYRRENFKVSNVVWTEFDGNSPGEEDYSNPPSLRVQSSHPGHEHVYWRLNAPIYNVDRLEEVNRTVTYALGADSSAWDATQVLRPPGTVNHKRSASVSIVTLHDTQYDVSVFNSLPKPPDPISADEFQPGQIPEIARVILKYAFPPEAIDLFHKPQMEKGTRSTGLMQLAYFCCEMGMSNPEIYAVLLNADNRWKKFADRKDQAKRLSHIITIARNKHPEFSGEEEPYAFVFDFVSFLNTEVEIDWVVEGMLMENGSMLMVGPSGIGKTQVSMRFAIHLALGKDYLHYTIPQARKCLFLSLEMGHGELKVFAETMAKGLNGSELEALQENLIVVPHGEKWPLNTPVGQEQLVKVIEAVSPDIIFVDSVGSSIAGSINNDEDVQALVDFNDRIRKKYDLSLWYIHHMRKSTNGGNAPSSQDDVYGNQYLVNRATSSYGLLRAKNGNIRVRNFKNRLHGAEEDYLIKRTDNLDFEKVNGDLDKIEIVHKAPEESKGPMHKFNL